VRLVFVIDAHDRKVLAWHAVASAGISGSMVRDLMLTAVELRFGTIQAPHTVEWLSDNGSAFTAREMLDFAAALGLVPCFTPVQSPELNGIAEAFVKTFKRDYARVHPMPDAATVLRQIAGWFDDYNESHPHSGYGLKCNRPAAASPSVSARARQYLRRDPRRQEGDAPNPIQASIARYGAGLTTLGHATRSVADRSGRPSLRCLAVATSHVVCHFCR